MDERVFCKAYIVAVCVRLIDDYYAMICVVVSVAFSYCIIFSQDVNIWLSSLFANLLEPVSQRFVIFCHKDDMRVRIKRACDFLTE